MAPALLAGFALLALAVYAGLESSAQSLGASIKAAAPTVGGVAGPAARLAASAEAAVKPAERGEAAERGETR